MTTTTIWAEWIVTERSRAKVGDPWDREYPVAFGKGAVIVSDGERVADVLMRRGMTSGGALRRRDLEVLQTRVMS